MDRQSLWLLQWNEHWRCYNLVGGHKRPDESFRECIIREIKEELGLEVGSDYAVSDQPRAHLEYTAWSEGAQEETVYTIEVFEVDLKDPCALKTINGKPANRWLRSIEIESGSSSDGRAVSPTTQLLLSRLDLLSPSVGESADGFHE